jgi:hypothetical protein
MGRDTMPGHHALGAPGGDIAFTVAGDTHPSISEGEAHPVHWLPLVR